MARLTAFMPALLALIFGSCGVTHAQMLDGACQPREYRLVLDVGHTPEASGATSARGVSEYAYNTKLAEYIAETLTKNGFTKAVVIKSHGIGEEQLRSRTLNANNLHPDLLISIHHDDAQRVFHEHWMFEGADREFSDRFSGYSIFVSRKNARFEKSLAAARLLGAALQKEGLLFSTHHAADIFGERRALIDPKLGVYLYDNLYLLRYSAAPAILLEAGVIVNRIEELAVTSPEGKRQISNAILSTARQLCHGGE
jgi:N-acetylmuramoyl-L-alanine amidase